MLFQSLFRSNKWIWIMAVLFHAGLALVLSVREIPLVGPVAELMRRFDLFVLPSIAEGISNTVLEAMASGLPAVNAIASGSNSLVVPGETGYLESARDDQAFVTRLSDLVKDAELRQSMGAKARERALTFSWDSILSGLLASYREVLAETGHGRRA